MLTRAPQRVEKNTNELHKEAKNYLDAVRAMSASSARIAATLDLFYAGHSGDEAIAIGAYKRAVEDLENSVAQSVVRLCSLACRSCPALTPERLGRAVPNDRA